MKPTYDLAFVLIAIIIGVISTGYFYHSAGIFVDLLKKPLRLISSGMMLMTFGILLAVFISYSSSLGIVTLIYGVPVQALFYLLYIVGSIMILAGARQFAMRPR